MNTLRSHIAVAALATCAMGAATAAPVTLNTPTPAANKQNSYAAVLVTYTHNPAFDSGTPDTNSGSALYVGAFRMGTSAGSFAAFCIEAEAAATTADTYSFSLFNGDSRVNQLFGYAMNTLDWDASMTDGKIDPYKHVALQAALWELYDTSTGTALDDGGALGAGNFTINTGTSHADTQTVLGLANQLLSGYASYSGPAVSLVRASAAGQDMLFTTDASTATALSSPVPEPATYALMLGGLALMGSAARRRAAPRA